MALIESPRRPTGGRRDQRGRATRRQLVLERAAARAAAGRPPAGRPAGTPAPVARVDPQPAAPPAVTGIPTPRPRDIPIPRTGPLAARETRVGGPGMGAGRRTMTHRQAATVIVTALGLGLLLNAGALERSARADPYGTRRTVELAILHPLAVVTGALGLDRPRAALDALAGHSPTAELAPSGRDSSDGSPAVAGALVPVRSGVIHRAPPSGARQLPARVPTAADPLRLWVGGDSVAGFFGFGMDELATRSGVVAAHSHYRISTGLSRPDYYDWPAHLEEDMHTYDPEVVAFLVGANDDQPLQLADGSVADFGTGAWRAEYQRRVESVMARLSAEGRTVFWMGMPVMRNPEFDARMRVIEAIDRAAAARHPRVVYFDSRPVLADAAGGFATWLPDAGGGETRVRADDGIHLTPAGGSRLARAVLDAVLRELDGRDPGPAVRGAG